MAGYNSEERTQPAVCVRLSNLYGKSPPNSYLLNQFRYSEAQALAATKAFLYSSSIKRRILIWETDNKYERCIGLQALNSNSQLGLEPE